MKRKIAAIMAVITIFAMSDEMCFAEAVSEEVSAAASVNEEIAVDAVGAGEVINLNVAAGSDISTAVNEALATAAAAGSEAAPCTVVIPAGSYTISKALYIGSNTVLRAEGVTISYNGAEKCNFIVSGKSDVNVTAANAGYNGYSNITIIGGIFISNKNNTASMVKIAHARNVTITGLTLSGGGCSHQMEVCAIDGFTVNGCAFLDSQAVYDGKNKQEALQLDIPCSEDVYLNTYQDGTVMKNVTITNCTFRNVTRGIGTHTALLGAYHENIVISNNTFQNISEEAIVGLNYYNCSITGNVINNCGAGILFQYFKATPDDSIYSSVPAGAYVSNVRNDANTVISGNNIVTTYSKNCDEIQGIKVYGSKLAKATTGPDGKKIPAGDYYISGVTVSGNTITTAGNGIHLSDAKNCSITDNTIVGKNFSSSDSNAKKYDGIFFNEASTGIVIQNNSIKSMTRQGIFGMGGSSAASISGNKISSCTGYGIGLFNKCIMSGDISGNTITSAGGTGISVSTSSKVGNIASNTITKAGGTAINIYKNCTVSGSISGNKIVDTAEKYHGICISTSSTVNGKIEKNSITKSSRKYSGTQGILVYNKSVVKGAVISNTISNTKKHNISVTTSSKVGDITGNTLKNATGNAILIYNKSTVKKINKNKITSAKEKAIFIFALKNNLTISDNTISKGKNAGIVLQPGTTKYKITVKGNTVTVPKKCYAIRAINGKVSVTNNTFNKSSLGIKLDKGVKGKATKNKKK